VFLPTLSPEHGNKPSFGNNSSNLPTKYIYMYAYRRVNSPHSFYSFGVQSSGRAICISAKNHIIFER
jgi:hypothetical protein